MKVFVSPQGRLGNNLLQYFFAKILSDKLNAEVFTLFDLPNSFGLDYKKGERPQKNFCFLFEDCRGPYRSLLLNGKKIQDGWENIVDQILKLNVENVLVTGYFQIFSYFSEEKELIRKNFKFETKKQENVIGIHLRKDDISGTQNDLPDLWFEEMSSIFENHKKFLTTDSPECPIARRILSNGFELWESSPEETIITFSSFSDVVLSQGTFSWWIAFLSEGKKHNLIPETGWNSEKSRIKLFPKLENWIYYKIDNNSLIQISS